MPNDTLEHLRQQIDAVDNEIHTLLMRRARLGQQVRAAKADGDDDAPRLRPGREAAILKRLHDTHEGPLPFATVGHVFRELIAANLLMQMPLQVAVWGGSRRIAIWDMARAHFGTAAPFTPMQDADAALEAVRDNPGTVAVLAFDNDTPWWRMLSDHRTGAGLHIFARLPFFGDGEETAFAVGPSREASGDDTTLVVTDGPPAGGKGLASADGDHLVALPGFLETIENGVIIGSYANPINGGDM